MSLIVRVNREWMKRQIDAVRESIGRNVTFNVAETTPCTLCLPSGFYNAASDTTFYTHCPVCHGNYYLTTEVEHEVLARVHWVNDEAITATPGGKYFMGDATVTVDPSYLELAESTQNDKGTVTVDGHTMFITRIIPLGAPEPNRYRVVLKNAGDRPE